MGDYFDRRKFINFASMQRNIEALCKTYDRKRYYNGLDYR